MEEKEVLTVNRSLLWKILLVLGVCPLAAPFLTGLYHMTIESWALFDWLILWSYVYWPTYLLGLGLILLSARKLRGPKNNNGV